jgi:DNA integrity scanning protein DisA with diadenylate cyclase activity
MKPALVAVEEVGKGSKHSSAAKISKISEAIVFAVSVDGRITLFSHGEHALKRMG